MDNQHDRNEILEGLRRIDAAAVATTSKTGVRTRMMHYAYDENFNIYLSSQKGDPKLIQITNQSNISLLFRSKGSNWTEDYEIEIIGQAIIIKDEAERVEAFNREASRSPIVKYLLDEGKTDVLEAIKVIPREVKYRIAGEVAQGIPPTIITFETFETNELDLREVKARIKGWIIEIRIPFLVTSFVSFLIGTTVAYVRFDSFDLIYFTLALLGTLFLHAGSNVINDYFDHRSGNDEVNLEFVRPFSGGSRVIQLGLLSPHEVLAGALILFSLGSMIGLYLFIMLGWPIMLLGLIGVFSGFFYTNWPFYLAKRGLGEFFVGFNFGVLITMGSFFVQTQTINLEIALISIPMTILITAILFINEFPDYNADKKVGKRTLVVRLGREKAVHVYNFLMVSVYITLVIPVLLGISSLYSLLGLLSIPLAIRGVNHLRKNYNSSFDLIPANASTIYCFLITGFLMIIAYILEKFSYNNLLLIGIIIPLFCALIFGIQRHIERQIFIFHGIKELVKRTKSGT
jgi:1,4-dihydroxy-2-naphthoate octaprenyltransferase